MLGLGETRKVVGNYYDKGTLHGAKKFRLAPKVTGVGQYSHFHNSTMSKLGNRILESKKNFSASMPKLGVGGEYWTGSKVKKQTAA